MTNEPTKKRRLTDGERAYVRDQVDAGDRAQILTRFENMTSDMTRHGYGGYTQEDHYFRSVVTERIVNNPVWRMEYDLITGNMKDPTFEQPVHCRTREESALLERANRETANPDYWVRQPKS